MAGLLFTSALLFNWHWWNRTGETAVAETRLDAKRRFDLIGETADYFESNGYRKQNIFFPVLTRYLNPHILQFQFAKRRLAGVYAFDAHRDTTLEGQREAIARADYVLLFDEADHEIMQLFPSTKLYPQVRQLVLTDSTSRLVKEISTADGQHRISIYARRGPSQLSLHNMRPITGFLPFEGPYPQWNLPNVRWTTGHSASAQFKTSWTGVGTLMMRVQARMADQRINVFLDGQPLGTCQLQLPDVAVDCSFPILLSSASPVVDFRFAKSITEGDRQLSVLFLDVWLDHRPGPLSTTVQ